ncbi:AraD1 family protein [Jiulongibacter sediminis]|uniref:GguC protein n=1 Tax=Jiulongibacter sediminis TaxID=1605367 RepID=A0A0P7BVI0_9BACT|nr:AraD1 family protein [Jiulongibacter sediminis]KPM48673.1 GguC protein [Jiulongibacter sediminis]TBX25209.1 GguC protein [Jiulongibacter sediminis]
MRLVQLLSPSKERKVALVSGEKLHLLNIFTSVYDLVNQAMDTKKSMKELVELSLSGQKLNYEEVWAGKTDWQWLPCFDHPTDVNKCMVAGTGLTHKASAENRDKMNAAADAGTQTDSMKMYFMGEEGGKPGAGKVGTQPEWFYKGNGTVLKGHLEPLDIPNYALDGGEEPEIAGIYVINKNGEPVRIGFATGNEYSDHVMEKINYLYLAPSKIRTCSIGPELVIDENIFNNLRGMVTVKKGGKVLWEKEVKTGEANMAHSLENLEYHHFKYDNHRVPGQVHIHFFGTGAFSYGAGIKLEQDDSMVIDWPQMGKALINPIKHDESTEKQIKVLSLK